MCTKAYLLLFSTIVFRHGFNNLLISQSIIIFIYTFKTIFHYIESLLSFDSHTVGFTSYFMVFLSTGYIAQGERMRYRPMGDGKDLV